MVQFTCQKSKVKVTASLNVVCNVIVYKLHAILLTLWTFVYFQRGFQVIILHDIKFVYHRRLMLCDRAFGRVCLCVYVCLPRSGSNFWMHWPTNFIFATQYKNICAVEYQKFLCDSWHFLVVNFQTHLSNCKKKLLFRCRRMLNLFSY